MRIPRFYTEQTLVVGQSLLLEQAPSHHLARVLRLRQGDEVLLFNGNGSEFLAVYEAVEGGHARVMITGVQQPPRESVLRIHLGQGVSRGERMDMVIQKSVELGVYAITPLWTRRSQVQLSDKRLDKRLAHWQGIMQSACEQSGRVYLPSCHTPASLHDWLEQSAATTPGIVLDPEAELTFSALEPGQDLRILIGPEGGLEPEEIARAVAAGFHRIRLGPRILRTETAALTALAALQFRWGDLDR
jgi:16S rRNA (uracil1498-N3)-methyltransferase